MNCPGGYDTIDTIDRCRDAANRLKTAGETFSNEYQGAEYEDGDWKEVQGGCYHCAACEDNFYFVFNPVNKYGSDFRIDASPVCYRRENGSTPQGAQLASHRYTSRQPQLSMLDDAHTTPRPSPNSTRHADRWPVFEHCDRHRWRLCCWRPDCSGTTAAVS